MFSRYEQHNHRPDGRNNKADRSRHLWQPWVERAANFDGENALLVGTRGSYSFTHIIYIYIIYYRPARVRFIRFRPANIVAFLQCTSCVRFVDRLSFAPPVHILCH